MSTGRNIESVQKMTVKGSDDAGKTHTVLNNAQKKMDFSVQENTKNSLTQQRLRKKSIQFQHQHFVDKSK